MQRILRYSFLMVILMAAPVLAQAEVGDIPYQNIDPLEPARPLWEYISGAGFIMAVLGLGFMSSRRVKDA